MALPTTPTSFVPYAASSSTRRFRTDFTGAFGFFAYGIFAVIFMIAIGVFMYSRILAGNQAAKDAQLAKAAAAIDLNAVETFVRLHDRLLSGETLLKGHVAVSNFFAALGTLLPTSVRFASLHITLSDSGVIKVDGSGIAKSFNALAVTSTAFATDGRIKDAIFSGMNVNSKDGSVAFALSATLDPKMIVFSPSSTGSPQKSSPSTPTP